MLNVSPELYEILSLAMRYVFAFLGILIVLRTYRWLLSDRRSRRALLRKTPGAGSVGELIVLRGSRDFPPDTYLPVPREGTLGSARTCDLTVPCAGVRRVHLSFAWEDGVGLLLKPVHGCTLNIQTGVVPAPSESRHSILRHGDILTIGEAVLEFRVYAGLRGSSGFPAANVPETGSAPPLCPYPVPDGASVSPYPVPGVACQPMPNASCFSAEAPLSPDGQPFFSAVSSPQNPASSTAESPENDTASAVRLPDSPADRSQYRRPRRSDRWKEDWSE